MSINNAILSIVKRSNLISKKLCIASDKYSVLCTTSQICNYSTAKSNSEVDYSKTYPILYGKKLTNDKPDWNRAVTEAEKIVGYPTSFLSLRWLLSDEIANVALHLRKLVGSQHPLLKTAKSLMYNGRNNMQAWGLVVLLVSKAAGHVNISYLEDDESAGVLNKQRGLAEVTEMIRTSHLVHKGLVNIQPDSTITNTQIDDLTFGNKIALLSGDYLLGNSSAELANLRNQELIELMSSAVRDLAEAEFMGRRDSQNNPLPALPPQDINGYAINEWTIQNLLSGGALLGKSCQGTLILAGHDKKMQRQGFKFGKNLALAWQACLDLSPFIGDVPTQNLSFNLCSAPVMFHIEHDPSILIEINKGLESVDNVDYEKIHDIIIDGPGIELTKQLQRNHSEKALKVLSVFEDSDARQALTNIIIAMGDF